jgi:hypothetical protein
MPQTLCPEDAVSGHLRLQPTAPAAAPLRFKAYPQPDGNLGPVRGERSAGVQADTFVDLASRPPGATSR